MSDWLRGFEPSRERPFDVAAVTHLLRRSALGHPPELIARCLAAGPRGAAELLVAGEPPDARERALLERRALVLASEQGDDLAAWWWMRLLVTRHPLAARMGLFWHDHFATSNRKVRSAYWMAQQLAAFDAHGLGRFRELLLAVAKSPAMLRWLDNEENRKGRANENFARELFELFTLGRGHYSERDVQEAARAFTGWRIARERFFFDRRRHDNARKTVFGQTGRLTGEDVIDLVLARREHSQFLAERLLACFVGPDVPAEARAEFAECVRAQQGHIDEVLRVLLSSELFYASAHRGTRIRGPAEWIVWSLRTLGCTAAPLALHRAAGRMGQSLLAPPDVSGWDGEAAWISSATWLERANLAGRVGDGGAPYWLAPALAELVPFGVRRELDWFTVRLFPDGIDAQERQVLASQVRAEMRLPRPVRLAGLLRACLMLPRAHRC